MSILLYETRASITKVSGLIKTFEKRDWKGSTSYIYGLNGITTEFQSCGINVILGSSGSGKSTLLKILAGIDEPTRGSIVDSSTTVVNNVKRSTAYLNDQFHMSYDKKLTLNDVRKSLRDNSDDMVKICNSLEFPQSESAQNLLESDKRIFEIVLAISKLETPRGCILCFDEYFDKDFKSTHTKVSSYLAWLCRHDGLAMQVFIGTHSKGVLSSFGKEKVVILNKGYLFYESRGSEFSNSVQSYLPHQLKADMIN